MTFPHNCGNIKYYFSNCLLLEFYCHLFISVYVSCLKVILQISVKSGWCARSRLYNAPTLLIWFFSELQILKNIKFSCGNHLFWCNSYIVKKEYGACDVVMYINNIFQLFKFSDTWFTGQHEMDCTIFLKINITKINTNCYVAFGFHDRWRIHILL